MLKNKFGHTKYEPSSSLERQNPEVIPFQEGFLNVKKPPNGFCCSGGPWVGPLGLCGLWPPLGLCGLWPPLGAGMRGCRLDGIEVLGQDWRGEILVLGTVLLYCVRPCSCGVWSSVVFKGGVWCVYPSWRLHWGWHAMKGCVLYRLYQGFVLGVTGRWGGDGWWGCCGWGLMGPAGLV